MTRTAEINGKRLLQRLDDFAKIGETAAGGVNRQALTVGDRQARQLLADLAKARGFDVFQDRIANLFIRRRGRNNDAPAFLIGSHLDSQPTGGRYDGALGTLAAFEVLESLEDAAVETDVAIEVVAWTNEEGSRFAPGTMGSMAFSMGRIPDEWSDLKGADGASFAGELQATLDALAGAAMRPLGFPVSGYLELHIEQGPILEKERIPVGIVTGIQGTRWLEVTMTGQAAHAGTTSLAYRRDPMMAAVAAMDELYRTVMPGDDSARFTVGRFSLQPGSVNAIPGSVTFSVDIRHPNAQMLDRLEAQVQSTCARHADEKGCEATVKRFFDMPPAAFPEPLLDSVRRAADLIGLPARDMLSGAFHDALFVNRVAPSAMIFVPCRDGLSHNEAEYVEPEASVHGARLLLASTMEAVRALRA